MNRKLALIPTVLISSALLLTACSGNGQHNDPNKPAPTASSAPAANPGTGTGPTTTASPTTVVGYAKAPQDMTPQYRVMYRPFETNDPQIWQGAAAAGAKKYSEDPSTRSMTLQQYEALRTGGSSTMNDLVKTNREIESDYETSAQNISNFLAKNPNATLDDIKNNQSLVVNRYPDVYSAEVQQDNSTKFFFVVFTLKDPNFHGVRMQGILVPQPGKTPDFHMPGEAPSSAPQQ